MNAIVKQSSPAMVLRPQSFAELVQFANVAAKSKMVPPAYAGKPEDIMLAVQMGSELGLAPMQSLQNIATINGRPSVWGDAIIGLCRQSPACQDIVETFEGDGETLKAVCIAKRQGATPIRAEFSVADAKKAGLWGKQGPWQSYPRRMLQMRARGFALRDAFPDILRGLLTAEEAGDLPADRFAGTTIEAVPEPVSAAPAAPSETKRQTVNDWLNTLETDLNAARTGDEIDAILARDDVQQAQDKFRGTGKERLQHILDAAIARANDPASVETEEEMPT